MLGCDKDDLVCDLAETYHIFDYKAVPVPLLATLVCGLREDSRIQCKMAEMPISMNLFFMSAIYDKVAWLQWAQTKDAEHGRNMPESITAKLLDKEPKRQIMTFATGEEFSAEWRRITGADHGE